MTKITSKQATANSVIISFITIIIIINITKSDCRVMTLKVIQMHKIHVIT